MSVVKVNAPNALGGLKLEEANGSLNSIIKQGIGREPFPTLLPRSTDNPVQWIQFLHDFDNQGLPGWPLLSPVKVPMQKCDKCNREFFSPINLRRHMRVHHRFKKLNKDTLKNRELLSVFWDKLSADEAMEIVALKNATVEDLPGATVVKALASLIRKPGFPSLPHFCMKSGSALLEIVQARPSRFPISSQEFFSILDDASEKTFLSGPATSMQKYLFDGEVGKIGLDTKNLVAFTSFLLEQKLVEAWLADKEAEALRCQKLLVEEEEAAQKRQADIMEKKRRKKLRQKEQKAKEHRNEEAETRDSDDSMEANPPPETLARINTSDLEIQDLDGPSEISLAEIPPTPIQEEAYSEARLGVSFVDKKDSHISEIVEQRSHWKLGVSHWHVPPKPRAMSNGFYQMKNLSTSNSEIKPKHGMRDLRVAHTVNNKKVWSRKSKSEKDVDDLKLTVQEAYVQVGQDKKHELLIGSVAVNLSGPGILGKCDDADLAEHDCRREYQPLKKVNSVDERNSKSDSSTRDGENQSTAKFWRRRQEGKDYIPVQKDAEVDSSAPKDDSRTLNVNEVECNSPSSSGGAGGVPFSSETARTFLSQRWKDAIASDHVKLVLSPELDPPLIPGGGCPEASNPDDRIILSNAENREANGPLDSRAGKPESKPKPGKGLKKRYIPKQIAKDS